MCTPVIFYPASFHREVEGSKAVAVQGLGKGHIYSFSVQMFSPEGGRKGRANKSLEPARASHPSRLWLVHLCVVWPTDKTC